MTSHGRTFLLQISYAIRVWLLIPQMIRLNVHVLHSLRDKGRLTHLLPRNLTLTVTLERLVSILTPIFSIRILPIAIVTFYLLLRPDIDHRRILNQFSRGTWTETLTKFFTVLGFVFIWHLVNRIGHG